MLWKNVTGTSTSTTDEWGVSAKGDKPLVTAKAPFHGVAEEKGGKPVQEREFDLQTGINTRQDHTEILNM
jgi:hypothetical protein